MVGPSSNYVDNDDDEEEEEEEGKGLASERVFRHRFGTRSHASLSNAPPHHHHHHHRRHHHHQQDINPKGVVALLTSSATRYKP